MSRLLLCGARVVRDGSAAYSPDPVDILVDGDRIGAIEPATRGTIEPTPIRELL